MKEFFRSSTPSIRFPSTFSEHLWAIWLTLTLRPCPMVADHHPPWVAAHLHLMEVDQALDTQCLGRTSQLWGLGSPQPRRAAWMRRSCSSSLKTSVTSRAFICRRSWLRCLTPRSLRMIFPCSSSITYVSNKSSPDCSDLRWNHSVFSFHSLMYPCAKTILWSINPNFLYFICFAFKNKSGFLYYNKYIPALASIILM